MVHDREGEVSQLRRLAGVDCDAEQSCRSCVAARPNIYGVDALRRSIETMFRFARKPSHESANHSVEPIVTRTIVARGSKGECAVAFSGDLCAMDGASDDDSAALSEIERNEQGS